MVDSVVDPKSFLFFLCRCSVDFGVNTKEMSVSA